MMSTGLASTPWSSATTLVGDRPPLALVPTRPGLDRLLRTLPQIAKAVGLPVFAYDLATIEAATDFLVSTAADAGISDARFNLAFFAAPNAELFRRILGSDARLGVTCNTLEEIVALEKREFRSWDRVCFSGGVVGRRELHEVAQRGCVVHAASIGNLEALLEMRPRPRFGIRVTFDDKALKGLRLDEARAALVGPAGRAVVAIHAYPGTEITDLAALVDHATELMDLADALPGNVEVNFGGGFAYDYSDPNGNLERTIDLRWYFAEIRRALDQRSGPARLRLAWEPGRIAFAGAGFFVAEVLEVSERRDGTRDVHVDAAFTQCPSPKIRGRQHLVIAADAEGRRLWGAGSPARICGSTTLSTDMLLPEPCAIPDVAPGHRIVILDVGAYGRAGSYAFLGRRRPPEVLLEDDGFRTIRSRDALGHLADGVQDHGV